MDAAVQAAKEAVEKGHTSLVLEVEAKDEMKRTLSRTYNTTFEGYSRSI